MGYRASADRVDHQQGDDTLPGEYQQVNAMRYPEREYRGHKEGG